jgi:peptidase E
MTKYILNSGGVRGNAEKSKVFFNEIINGLGDSPKILYCFFASARENWETKFKSYTEGFVAQIPNNIKPKFELAMPKTFESQIKENDVIFIAGGDDYLLQYWLSQYDLPRVWKDKIIAGTSAGSSSLCVSSWTCDWRECIDGLGILPIKFIPHYQSETSSHNDPRGDIDWEQAYQELTDYGDKSLPIYALCEGDYTIIEV